MSFYFLEGSQNLVRCYIDDNTLKTSATVVRWLGYLRKERQNRELSSPHHTTHHLCELSIRFLFLIVALFLCAFPDVGLEDSLASFPQRGLTLLSLRRRRYSSGEEPCSYILEPLSLPRSQLLTKGLIFIHD